MAWLAHGTRASCKAPSNTSSPGIFVAAYAPDLPGEKFPLRWMHLSSAGDLPRELIPMRHGRDDSMELMAAHIIREATAGDAPAIVALYRSAGIESATSFTPEEARAHFAVFSRYPNYRLFVATAERRIVGCYALLIMDNLAKRGRRSGVVEDLVVSPEQQGHGIGRALIQHARERCREAGCYKFVLSSGISREKAHAFYESIGLKRHGFSFLAGTE
jgi:ribosomal protein S18 acetylase RimI-like enzyme